MLTMLILIKNHVLMINQTQSNLVYVVPGKKVVRLISNNNTKLLIFMVSTDDAPSKLKKNNSNITKHIVYGNEECLKVDNNIVLIHEGNISTTVFENYDLLSNQLVLQSSDSYNFDSTKTEPGMLYEIE